MARAARVTSVDALKQFRAALLKFCESSDRALIEAESEIHRTLDWIQHDRIAHWQRQARKRAEEVEAARHALSRRQIRADTDDPTCVEERIALNRARQRVKEAEEKIQRCRAWARTLQREMEQYAAKIQRLAGAVRADLPEGADRLGRMVEAIEGYLAVAAPSTSASAPADDRTDSMARGGMGTTTGEIPRAAPGCGASDNRFAALRARTRQLLLRLADDADRPAPADATGTPPDSVTDQSDLPARIGLRPSPIEASDPVLVEEGALDRSACYMERRGESPVWLIAAADPGEGSGRLVVIRAAAVARRHPEFWRALALPPGYLVLVKNDEIRVVVDEHDRESWVAHTENE